GDAARHDLLDDRAAEAADLLRVHERHDRLADRVHAADSGAEHRSRRPVDALVAGLWPFEPRVLPGLDRGERAVLDVRVHRQELVARERLRRELVDARWDAG